MANTMEQVIAYARAHPTRDGKSWSGWCESFVWRAGGFNGSFNNALAAGSASGPLNSNWASAPRGAIHYWAGVGGDGHVAFSLGGGMLLMASSRTSNYGVALGTLHFSNYGLPLYRGWTMRHGVETLEPSSSTAGNGYTSLEEDMGDASEASVQESIRIGNVLYVKTQEVLAALQRAELREAGDATEASVQEAIRISNETWDRAGKLLSQPASVIDPVKLAAALKATGIKIEIDSAALVKLLEASLADDFKGIPKAVNDDAAKRLSK